MSFWRCPPSQSLGLVRKKLNLTQQKHTFTNQKKCTTTQNKQKTKAMFSRLVRHPAWKWRGPILISALHLLTYLDTYPLSYSPRPTQGVHHQTLKWRNTANTVSTHYWTVSVTAWCVTYAMQQETQPLKQNTTELPHSIPRFKVRPKYKLLLLRHIILVT